MNKPRKPAAGRGKPKSKLPGWLPEVAQVQSRGAKGAAKAGSERGARGLRGNAPASNAGKAYTPVGKPARHDRPHASPQDEREKQRYEFPIASRETILEHLGERAQLLTAEALAQELNLASPRDFEALTKRLAAMLRDGQLLQNRRGGYGVAQKLDLIPGAIIANAEGFGFLRPDGGGDDVYISPAEMRKVLHGDRVLLSIVGVDKRGRKQGAIVEVLERRASRL
ncbi:MAG TPA: ribonuclease R, partial [Rudaea sp.]|nr:ribonuclease R [Rudaea sp.]